MENNHIIPVVAACILSYDSSKLLLHTKDEAADEKGISRNPELCGKWEFPGGMVEYGETPEDALHREIKEELNRNIRIVGVIDSRSHIFKDKVHYLVLYYVCRMVPQETLPSNCQWFKFNQVQSLDSLAHTYEVSQLIAQRIGGSNETQSR